MTNKSPQLVKKAITIKITFLLSINFSSRNILRIFLLTPDKIMEQALWMIVAMKYIVSMIALVALFAIRSFSVCFYHFLHWLYWFLRLEDVICEEIINKSLLNWILFYLCTFSLFLKRRWIYFLGFFTWKYYWFLCFL